MPLKIFWCDRSYVCDVESTEGIYMLLEVCSGCQFSPPVFWNFLTQPDTVPSINKFIHSVLSVFLFLGKLFRIFFCYLALISCLLLPHVISSTFIHHVHSHSMSLSMMLVLCLIGSTCQTVLCCTSGFSSHPACREE